MDIFISVPAQTLELFEADRLLARYSVSTAKAGVGEENGSYRTPRGRHVIRARIGAGMPANTVFVGRRPTGEIWTPELAARHPGRDWMLTRLLWLSGKEPGFNRFGRVDTMRRYIYLHGCPDSAPMGIPGSIGCVRMRNSDIIELFDRAPVGTAVNIGDFRTAELAWDAAREPAYAVRDEVFVREQGVPVELEHDDRDQGARHVLAFDAAGTPIGYGRLVDGAPESARIGRMAVMRAWRGKGVGSAILRRLLDIARSGGGQGAVLAAQRQAEGFYARFGFVAEGEEFLEAGIPHVMMRRELRG